MPPTPTRKEHSRGDDARDLAGFGYSQKLDRSLGGFSAFAAGFSYLSVLTGSSQLFHMGYAAGGPAFFWTWPAVFAGQFLVALCFAELAGRYPLSGGVYQWSKQVGGDAHGWMAGWVYLSCAVITLASVALALQTTLPQISPIFQLIGNAGDPADATRNAVLLGCVVVAVSTAVNAFGVRLMARINNLGVVVEMLAAVGLIALLAFAARRSPAVVLDGLAHGDGTAWGYLSGPALPASLMAVFVLYGFDTAGSLAEETDDPRRRAPRAILLALAAVGVAGSLLVLAAVVSARDLDDPMLGKGAGGLPYLVKDVLGPAIGAPLLIGIAFAIFVCVLAVHAAGVRLVFAMARDNHLPGARALASVHERTRTPTLPAVLLELACIALLLMNVNFPRVMECMASVAVVWANLAYLYVTAPLLARRIRGELGFSVDRADDAGLGSFSLGRWGLLVNVLAVVWGAALIINTGWPRPEIFGGVWFGATGALVPTALMLLVGWAYDRLFRRRRVGGVLEDHRAPDAEISAPTHPDPAPA